MDEIDKIIMKTDEKRYLMKCLVCTLAEREWFGYRPKAFHQQFVEQVIRRRIISLANYIYDNELCHVTLLSQCSERELKEITRRKT